MNPASLRDRREVVGVVLAPLEVTGPSPVVAGIDSIQPDVQGDALGLRARLDGAHGSLLGCPLPACPIPERSVSVGWPKYWYARRVAAPSQPGPAYVQRSSRSTVVGGTPSRNTRAVEAQRQLLRGDVVDRPQRRDHRGRARVQERLRQAGVVAEHLVAAADLARVEEHERRPREARTP